MSRAPAFLAILALATGCQRRSDRTAQAQLVQLDVEYKALALRVDKSSSR